MKGTRNIDKMYTYLRGYLVGANMPESMKALQIAREKHDGQERKDGTPYIVHPLSMACYAIAIRLRDDNTVATILLHDVAEDCGVDINNLPLNDTIKRGIKYMTVVKLDENEEKVITKQRYFHQLLESKEAVICKSIDRYDNLTSMVGVLSEEAIIKNIKETNELLLPVLKQAKEKWVELSDILFVLKTNITGINNTLEKVYLK